MTFGELRAWVERAGIDGQRMPDDAPVVIVGADSTYRAVRCGVGWTCDQATVTAGQVVDYEVPRTPTMVIIE